MFGSFLEGDTIHFDNASRLFQEENMRQFYSGILSDSRRETLYAQRELSMTGFAVASDMTWSVASAGRKKVTVTIAQVHISCRLDA